MTVERFERDVGALLGFDPAGRPAAPPKRRTRIVAAAAALLCIGGVGALVLSRPALRPPIGSVAPAPAPAPPATADASRMASPAATQASIEQDRSRAPSRPKSRSVRRPPVANAGREAASIRDTRAKPAIVVSEPSTPVANDGTRRDLDAPHAPGRE